MIRLRLSRRIVRRVALVLLVGGLLAGCYFLGDGLTPRDAAGRPLILSPSVYAAERYRREAAAWVEETAEVDRGLTALLGQGEVTDPAQLYALSRQVEELVEQATGLARDAAFTPAPAGLVGFREQAQAATQAYLEAALATAHWVGAPEPEGRVGALEALRTARGLRAQLAASRWLSGRP